jgi:cobalt/nickel transport system permease protein
MLAAALLPRALDRAHRLEVGLAARGFDGSLRTLAPARPASPARLAAIAALLVGVGGAGAWM